MIEKEKITEVSKFVAINRNMCYLQNSKFVIDEKTVCFFENPFGDIYSNGNSTIWQDYLGQFNIYGSTGELIAKRKGYFNYLTKKHEELFYFDPDQNCLKLIKILDHDIIFTSIKSNGLIDSNMFFELTKEVMSIYSLTGDKLIFTYTLPEIKYDWYTKSNYENAPDELHKGEISRIIGVYSETLWIVLNSGVILCLECDTGKLVYELGQPNNYREQKKPFNLGINTQMDAERGILFGLRNKYYWEIDLLNPENKYLLYDISVSSDNWNISADMPLREWSWFEDKIYFGEIYDSPHHQNLNNVGVFDRKAKEVVHAMRIGEGGRRDMIPNIQKIQFEAGRLYVLDGCQVLHIFEED